MKFDSSISPSPTRSAIELDLHGACRHLRYARITQIMCLRIRHGISLVFPVVLVAVVLVVLARLFGFSSSQVAVAVSILAGVGAAAVLAPAIPWLVRRPALDDVAERLDLATDNHSRIATALDLLRSNDHSPFARHAVAQGILAAKAAGRERPHDPAGSPAAGIPWTRALIAIVALLLAIGWPSRGIETGYATADGVSPVAAALGSGTDPEPKADTRKSPATPPTGPAGRPASGATPLGRQGASAGNEGAAQAPTSSAGGAFESSSAGSPSGAVNAPMPAGANGKARPGAARATAGSPVSAGTKAGASAETATPESAAGTAGSTGATSVAAAAGGSTADRSSADRPVGAGGDESPPASEGPKSSKPDNSNQKSGSQRGPAAAEGSAGNGAGQTSSLSAPKKSRGVPPMMFESKVPEQLTGLAQVGPVVRTPSRMPPTPMPTDPAPARAVTANTSPEMPALPFRVPGELQGVVGDYFVQLHQDAPGSESPNRPAAPTR